MDGVATPIIGRPRPLPSHDTPNPAHNTYTLKCEEPGKGFCAQEQNHEGARGQVMRIRIGYSLADRLISYPHRHTLSACS